MTMKNMIMSERASMWNAGCRDAEQVRRRSPASGAQPQVHAARPLNA
jgi:hypothetical protein